MWQTKFRQMNTKKSLCEVLYDVVTQVIDVRYYPNKYSWVSCQIITNQISDSVHCQQVPRSNTKYFEVFTPMNWCIVVFWFMELLPWIWKQKMPHKRWYVFATPHISYHWNTASSSSNWAKDYVLLHLNCFYFSSSWYYNFVNYSDKCSSSRQVKTDVHNKSPLITRFTLTSI
jgi:hypothetical protein